MNYRAPPYGGTPAVDSEGSSKTPLIVIVVTVILTVILVVILAIALGVGLGVGLRQSNQVITKLSAPGVNCDVTSAACGCAVSKPAFSSRIINGETAAVSSWPWMVYLLMNSTKICSGFLITQRHVITASSCVRNFGTNITVSYGTSTFLSAIGATNVTMSNFTMDAYDSVAILTLGINLTYSATVQPCCLSSDPTEPFYKEHGVIAGWGETSSNGNSTVAPNLQQAVVQVLNPSSCGLTSTANQICAGFGSISTCPIDAGAPLMTTANNAWTCVGIVSGGRTTCTNPTTFTRIDAYQLFIRNVTGLIF